MNDPWKPPLIYHFEGTRAPFLVFINSLWTCCLHYLDDGTTRATPFRNTMGLPSAFAPQFTLLLLFTVSFVFALPTHHDRGSAATHHIIHAVGRDLLVDEVSGTVVNSVDQSRVDQGPASDGAGSGFDVPAILWLSFGMAIGLYLTLCGMRLWVITTAFAIGLVLAFCCQSSPPGNP